MDLHDRNDPNLDPHPLQNRHRGVCVRFDRVDNARHPDDTTPSGVFIGDGGVGRRFDGDNADIDGDVTVSVEVFSITFARL